MTFVKGVSGNPGGRPKRRLLSDALNDELQKAARNGTDRTKAEAIITRLVNIVLTGDRGESVAAAKLLWAYHEGQPTQPIVIEDEARRVAAERGLDPDRVITLFESIKRRAS
jgi:Family of unknown function (DUF5681)